MCELADGEPEDDGHVGGRHPRRDPDAEDAEEPLPYAVASPRRLSSLLPRKQKDNHHDRQHGEGGEKNSYCLLKKCPLSTFPFHLAFTLVLCDCFFFKGHPINDQNSRIRQARPSNSTKSHATENIRCS